MRVFSISKLAACLTAVSLAGAVSLDLSDTDSVNSALALIAKGLMDYYWGYQYGGTVGMFTSPYYWWEAGAAWNSILDFWYYTGNDTYNDILYESLQYQVGDNKDYMPSNQTTTEGNDDQGFWGITVMAAAEKNFTNPPEDKPGWLYLAQAVFNEMAGRWETSYCGGGLRWQIYTWNAGYDYKNTVSNGCMFNIGARLGRYTGNSSYVDWAEKVWDWITDIGFISVNESNSYIYDGGKITDNCSTHTNLEWTYNYGLFLSGCAFLYDYTNDTKWETRATAIWSRAKVFFDDGVMYEAACQTGNKCNTDQRCFKAIFSRFLGHTAYFIPSLKDEIMDYLASSAAAAAQSCSGGTDGHTCGQDWRVSGWDDLYGLGEQMSALEVIQNNLVFNKAGPLTNRTGGTSTGSSDAGTSSSSNLITNTLTITTKDRAGAGVLTVVCLVGLCATGFWMLK